MEAFLVEESILEGEKGIKELFEFVRGNAVSLEAYDIEGAIFSKVMKTCLPPGR